MNLAEIRLAIEAHQALRPDALEATHPLATKAVRDRWSAWCDRMGHLRTQEGMALAAERSGWRDVTGQPTVDPINWTEGKGAFLNLNQGPPKCPPKAPGRPRKDHPSKETIQRRHQRARLREVQG